MKYNYINGTFTHSTLEEGYDFFIKDDEGKEYHFKISTFPVPSGFLSEAIQVIDRKGIEPYIFTVLAEFESDEEHSELLLKDKIKRGINHKSLREEDGRLAIGTKNKVCGRIEYNDDMSDTIHERILVIDGKRITVEKFLDLIQPVEGFNFTLQIYDPSDDYLK